MSPHRGHDFVDLIEVTMAGAAEATGLVRGGPRTARKGQAPSDAATRRPVLVLQKVRLLLDAFTPAEPELTAREVQRLTGLPATTCLRLLQTLVDEGFLDRSGDKYRPGLALLTWARTAEAGLDLVAVAAPVLAALRDATGESACLFLRHDGHHTCVAVKETPHAVIHILRVGQVLPLHAGSAGRVFLAFDPEAAQHLQSPLPPCTPHTITQPRTLEQSVATTRQDGYAFTSEERSIGAASLSAPVFGRSGALAAVLGIASPVQRLGPELVPVYAPQVTRAAAELSRRLGHTGGGQTVAI